MVRLSYQGNTSHARKTETLQFGSKQFMGWLTAL
jgi:hypothetical protein